MKGPGDFSEAIRNLWGRCWLAYGKLVYKLPWVPLVISLVVAIICLAGVPRLETETKQEELFYIQSGQVWDELQLTRSLFAEDVKATSLYFEFPNATDVFSYEVMADVFALHQEILAVRGTNNRLHQDYCARASHSEPCLPTNAFMLLNITSLAQLSTISANDGVLRNAFHRYQHYASTGNGQCLMLVYVYDYGNQDPNAYSEWSDEWELNTYTKVLDYSSGRFGVAVLNRKLALDRTNNLSRAVMPLMFAAVVIIVFLVVAIISGKPCVDSRIFLGMSTVLSVLLAMFTSYGLAGFFNIKQSPVTVLMLFVLLGVGVDDIVIIIHSTDAVKRRLPELSDRIPTGLEHAGLAITLTSLTSAAAFSAATAVPLGMARSFCTFGIIAIIMLFWTQGTFFLGLFIFDEKRRKAMRYEGLCCMKAAAPPEPATEDEQIQSGRRSSVRRKRWRRLGDVLVSPAGIAVSLVTWIIFVASTTAQLPQVTTEFDLASYYPDDDPFRKGLLIQSRYYEGNAQDLYVYIKGVGNRWFTTEELSALNRTFVAIDAKPWVQSPSMHRAERDWTKAFELWLDCSSCLASVGQDANSIASLAFNEQLALFLSASPFPIVDGGSCSNTLQCIKPTDFRIMLNLDANGVPTYSRVLYKAFLPSGGQIGIDRRKDTMATVAANLPPLEGFPFTWYFLGAYRDEIILPLLMESLGITCAVIAIMLMVFLDILTGLFVGVCIILLDLSVLGCLAAMGKPLSVVMFLNLTMVIGMCVDYVVHTSHDFLREFRKGEEAGEAVVKVMESMGRWIFEGALSTLCGLMLPALFATSEAARTFGITMCLAIVFGVLYGLVWAPTLMYIMAKIWTRLRPSPKNKVTHEGDAYNTASVAPEKVPATTNSQDPVEESDGDKVNAWSAAEK